MTKLQTEQGEKKKNWSFIVQLYNPLKGCLVRIVSNVQ